MFCMVLGGFLVSGVVNGICFHLATNDSTVQSRQSTLVMKEVGSQTVKTRANRNQRSGQPNGQDKAKLESVGHFNVDLTPITSVLT